MTNTWLYSLRNDIVLVEGLLLGLLGRGPLLVALPWADIVAESFAVLTALSIAYFMIGVYTDVRAAQR